MKEGGGGRGKSVREEGERIEGRGNRHHGSPIFIFDITFIFWLNIALTTAHDAPCSFAISMTSFPTVIPRSGLANQIVFPSKKRN